MVFKRFIIAVLAVSLLWAGWYYLHYSKGAYLPARGDGAVSVPVKAEGQSFFRYDPDTGQYAPFTVKGVNMGAGIPGHWATDFAIDYDTYLLWFGQIADMGANTLRVYTIQSEAFYNAFYAFNTARERDGLDPLLLLQGVWVNDYSQNSRRDYYDEDLLQTFLEDCRTAVNVLHGAQNLSRGEISGAGSGIYRKDVSPWVLGYILGVEWEDLTVAYTDQKYPDAAFRGTYFRTSEDATPTECFLARVGERIVDYETSRYGVQRPIAFSNWPTTDPFEYSEKVTRHFYKCARVDVEHLQATEEFHAGQFASYHVYPYYPDYLQYESDWSRFGLPDPTAFFTPEGELNTYRAYLTMLAGHHTMPVLISEFGVSTGRGMAQRDLNTGRNQGNLSEKAQGEALVRCWEDIMASGCSGACVFTWQDEWFKRTWNTMYAVNLTRTPYWSDYQTNEQYFGLLAFDPGEEESVCYVDGDPAEWEGDEPLCEQDGLQLTMKYDEKFLYFLVRWDDPAYPPGRLYIPLDITPKSGALRCPDYALTFPRGVDFLVILEDGPNSRVLVQERYEALRANYSREVCGFDTYLTGNIPAADSRKFVPINMILQTATALLTGEAEAPAEVYETGALVCGNANPASADFNSLADFCFGEACVELRLPWQLLNFADPSRMTVHDDYYDGNYGVEFLSVDRLYAGVSPQSRSATSVSMEALPLKGWGDRVTAHPRLKQSYYAMQELWTAK
ncbi:MAG: hypothetical protein PUB51_03585 [Oscillospiraceae bacterium]|nr:hypothetical protein [Oscillospiraceae bacterium]